LAAGALLLNPNSDPEFVAFAVTLTRHHRVLEHKQIHVRTLIITQCDPITGPSPLCEAYYKVNRILGGVDWSLIQTMAEDAKEMYCCLIGMWRGLRFPENPPTVGESVTVLMGGSSAITPKSSLTSIRAATVDRGPTNVGRVLREKFASRLNVTLQLRRPHVPSSSPPVVPVSTPRAVSSALALVGYRAVPSFLRPRMPPAAAELIACHRLTLASDYYPQGYRATDCFFYWCRRSAPGLLHYQIPPEEAVDFWVTARSVCLGARTPWADALPGFKDAKVTLVVDNAAAVFAMRHGFSSNPRASALIEAHRELFKRVEDYILVISLDNPSDCCSRNKTVDWVLRRPNAEAHTSFNRRTMDMMKCVDYRRRCLERTKLKEGVPCVTSRQPRPSFLTKTTPRCSRMRTPPTTFHQIPKE
jgi:hypothetical protein